MNSRLSRTVRESHRLMNREDKTGLSLVPTTKAKARRTTVKDSVDSAEEEEVVRASEAQEEVKASEVAVVVETKETKEKTSEASEPKVKVSETPESREEALEVTGELTEVPESSPVIDHVSDFATKLKLNKKTLN